MPIISTKRLAALVRSSVDEALEEFHTDIRASVERLAWANVDKVQYKVMEDKVQLLLDQQAQLREANTILGRQVLALQQILHGQAHEEVRKALVEVTEKLAVLNEGQDE